MGLMGSRTRLSGVDSFPTQEQMRRFSAPSQHIRFGLEFDERSSPCLEVEILVRALPVVFGEKEGC
jgi:hypothetical protein